jgi:formylglycine-generating enzyme required for sulfatase activity
MAAAMRSSNSRTIPDLNLDLVWIAPGAFLMGTPEQNVFAKWYYEVQAKRTGVFFNPAYDTRDERPQTWVTLTQPFWLGRTPVTQGEFEAVMGAKPSNVTDPELPVDRVSWDDAMAFCKKLTERERMLGRIPAGYAYTLPTEAQWEYAARAGRTGPYLGDLDVLAWYSANSGGTTHKVGTKAPNAWGLFDMEGNVIEWCRDLYVDHLPGGDVTNPTGPSFGFDHVGRGCDCNSPAAGCDPAIRIGDVSYDQDRHVGFRLALCLTK